MANGMAVQILDGSDDTPYSFKQVPSTPGGIGAFSKLATADTNAANLKASGGRVFGWSIANSTASAKYVRFYNKASAPNPAADAALIVLRILVPANGVASFHTDKGFNGFTAGVAIDATGGSADTDATALAAGDLTINVFYA